MGKSVSSETNGVRMTQTLLNHECCGRAVSLRLKQWNDANPVKMSKAGATRDAKGMCEGCGMKRGEGRRVRGEMREVDLLLDALVCPARSPRSEKRSSEVGNDERIIDASTRWWVPACPQLGLGRSLALFLLDLEHLDLSILEVLGQS
jgi:hypothetical protein